MSKIIGIDLDEILAEFVDFALKHHDYKLNGKIIKRESIIDYHLYKIVKYDITSEKSLEWFREAMFIDMNKLEIKPVLGAIDKLIEHKNKGYIFKIVTARDGGLFGEYTKKWIEKHYPNIFDDIIFANHFSINDKSKGELCIENNIFHMVEDNLDYALDLANNGIITYLIEKPWNKYRLETHKNIIKVKSWDEIYF